MLKAYNSGGSRGGSRGAQEPPFWLHLALRSIVMLGKWNPPFLATELRKLLLWLTLECFRRNSFENRSIGLVELVVCLKNDRKWAWF